jgi:undecaprenyl-diphosphatase
MTIFQAVLLGVVQGLTEFLPVSSSGHLVIVPFLLQWELLPQETFVFDVLVQVATLAGVFAFFWQDFIQIARAMICDLRNRRPFSSQPSRLGWYIVLATIPASVVGLAFLDGIENSFSNPLLAGIALLFTAGLLALAERFGRRNRPLEDMTWLDGLVVGLFQVFALLPGISRSGATITGGMTRDLERRAAARFSFLMSAPVLFAAGLVSTVDLLQFEDLSLVLPRFIPGFLSAGIVGYLSIGWLLKVLNKQPLYYFSAYCVLMGLITLATYFFRN